MTIQHPFIDGQALVNEAQMQLWEAMEKYRRSFGAVTVLRDQFAIAAITSPNKRKRREYRAKAQALQLIAKELR